MKSKDIAIGLAVLPVWVKSKKVAIADGVATSLFLSKPENLRIYFDFEYFILRKNFSFEKSRGFDADLYL